MKALDIIMAIKLSEFNKYSDWSFKSLENDLHINRSQLHDAYQRLIEAQIIQLNRLNRRHLLEFLEHGLRYTFPASKEGFNEGVKASRSNPLIANKISINNDIVWYYSKDKQEGLNLPKEDKVKGESIKPLHDSLLKSYQHSDRFKNMIDMVDVLRMSDCKLREKHIALPELEKMIYSKSYTKTESVLC